MWPETIWLLTDHIDISSDDTKTIEEWVAYCLPDHETRKAYYVMRTRLGNWEADNSDLFCELLNVVSRGRQWNHLVRCRYNLTFALLGYTEGQSSKILSCLPHIQNDVSFRNYHPVVYPCGIYYTTRKPRAKTLIKKVPYYGQGRTRR